MIRLDEISPFGLLFKGLGKFFGKILAQIVVAFWSTFLKSIFYIFMLINSFKAWFVVGTKISERSCRFLDFQIEH